MPVDLIRWLLTEGADPHIEDAAGKDCCDKVKELGLYHELKIFWKKSCIKKRQLRTKFRKAVVDLNNL